MAEPHRVCPFEFISVFTYFYEALDMLGASGKGIIDKNIKISLQ